MGRSATVSRFVMLATLASIAAGLIGAAPTFARDPHASRQVRLDTPSGRKAAPEHRARTVRVSDAPKATKGSKSRAAHRPLLRGPLPTSTGTKPLSPRPLAPDPSVFAGSSGQPDAEETTDWDGIADPSLEPPDPWVAAGPDHIVQAVNTTFQISTRSGTHVQTVDMFDFFDLGLFYEPGDVSYFDPRVIYDSLHGRWIAIESSFDCIVTEDSDVGSGYLDIAISQSADPTGVWEVISFGYTDVVLDYPGLGTSTDKVALSANVFGLVDTGGSCDGGTFLGTEIDAVAWSQLTGTGAINFDPFIDTTVGYFSWRPALQTPATSSTIHLVSEGPAGEVVYARLTGNPAVGSSVLSTPADLTGTDVLPAFDVPPPPQQPGGTIADAADERPTDAVWQDNHLAFVSTAGCDPAGGATEERDCVRVSELSTATTTPTALQDFFIGEEGADHYMGGVGYAGNGDLHVVWTRSSEAAGEYASSYAAHHLVSDAANAISDPQLLQVGAKAYSGDRWGDYVGVSQDPQVPNAVWQANQFADDTLWGTHVSQLQTGGSSYVPITPERVVDSRSNVGVTGVFNASSPKSFQVAGVGPIPADAVAVTGNVTVTGQTAAGFVAITPNATSTPPSSTLNFPLGDTRANNFTASLNSAGKLAAVYKAASGTKAHIIVDITGYFLAGSDDATYTTTDPVRVMDTRPAPQHVGSATTFQHGVTQTLLIADGVTVPADATAITGNLTVVGQSRAGFLSVTPDPPVGTPGSSTLNFPVGDVRANGLTADLNADGELSITYIAAAGATTNAALDITGYYVEDNTGLLFYPLNPGRVLDSRSGAKLSGITGSFKSSIPKTLPVGGHWGVPTGAEAVTGNLTVANQTAAGFVSITPTADANPTTSTLNFPLGDIRANGVTVPLDSNSLALVYKATTGKTTHLLLDVTGYFR